MIPSMTSDLPTRDGSAVAPLRLLTEQPVRPTPAGAFRAVARPDTDAIGRMLLRTMGRPVSPMLTVAAVREWTGIDDDQGALALLKAAQDDALIEALETPEILPDSPLDDLVPPLLATLSDEGRALLADAHGRLVWSSGFDDSVAVRLAALSADLSALRERHAATIADALDDPPSGWALVDGVGASRIGCWPLHIGGTRFVFVAQGLPRMHHPNFTTLVWLLVHRYG
jgi:hypothetical protein